MSKQLTRSKLSAKRKTASNSKSKERFLHLAISGTPGTGKSTIARQISTMLDIAYIDLTYIIKQNKLYCAYDSKAKTYDVDIKTLEKYLRATLSQKQSYILDSHLSHHLSKRLVSHVLVCTCSLKTLNKRLVSRKYSKHKIQDNLQAEIFDVCSSEALENGFPVEKIDCTKKLSKEKIKSHLRQLLLLQ